MSRKAFLLFFVVGILALPAFGQTFGQISGVVHDATGAIVPGATITVTNPRTNFTRATASNESGIYSFPSLLPGLYEVRAEMQGFQNEVHAGVELQVQQTARIDFAMKVGSVTDTVTVLGGAPLLNTENATLGAVIEQKRIEDLPLNGRSFISLIALSPNVTAGQTSTGGNAQTRGGSDRGTVSISVAGNRREYTYYTLDGISNTEVDFNTYAFLPSIDALQEFKVQTGAYSAEFGRQAVQVNVSTRSGTNAYHGTVFEFLRNNALDARPYAFTSAVPASAPFKWNQYGFTLGGPVQIPKIFNGKDRLFFMSNYEGFKLRNQNQQIFTVPSAAMRKGDFSELLPGTVIKDPLNNNQPFPGNIIPTQRLHPIALGLLEFYPLLPNIPGAGLANNLLVLQNKTTDKDQFSQRIDFVQSTKSSWFGRFSWQDEFKVDPNMYRNGTTVTNTIKQAVISNTHIFSPTLVNDFRAGWLGYRNIFAHEGQTLGRNVIRELNLAFQEPDRIAWGVPTVGITGFSGFGDTTQGPFLTNNHTLQWSDGLTWIHGTHSLKFGADIRRDRYNPTGNQGVRGSFAVQNQATGYGFADYMLGYIQGATQAGSLAVTQLRATSQAYYITDNWKIRPNLTIDVGLRYEYTAPWNSRGDNFANAIIPDKAVNFTPGTPVGEHPYLARDCAAYGQDSFYPPNSRARFDLRIVTKCDSSFGSTALVHKDFKNFAPRLGIAWSPTAKWTVRLGGGIFYTQDGGNAYLDTTRNIAGNVTSLADTAIHDLTMDRPFLFSGSSACGVPTPQFFCSSPGDVTAMDPNLRTAYVEQYELNIQRQLTDSTALEIGYLGSQGHRLLARVDYNVTPTGPGTILSRTPFPEFRKIQDTIGIGSSNYHSGTLRLTRRLSKGISYQAGYTFSKSLDDTSGIFPASGVAARKPRNGWCLRCEYGLSDFDTRHRLVTSVLYELPVGKGKQFLNQGIASTILGGWQLNSIVTASTGFPLGALVGFNQSNTNINETLPNAVPGVSSKLDHPTTSQWFNIQAFALQPAGTFGNAGRNTVISPGFLSWDFSTLKNFNFAESRYLQFRFECFNCANHPSFGDPNMTLGANRLNAAGVPIPGTGTFGTITSTRPGIDMRKLQFSLKLMF